MNFKDRLGLVYGKLTVVGFDKSIGKGVTYWHCRCECGATISVRGDNLQSGTTKSCGCLKQISPNKRHGMYGTSLYNVYSNMKQRCYNPKSTSYKDYGAKGITVCERWLGPEGFINFLASMGDRPSPDHSIDRIDTKGPYSPENCRWATWRTQQSNRSNNNVLTLDGKTQCLEAWSRDVGLGHKTISYRLKRGWPLRAALYTPAGARPILD